VHIPVYTMTTVKVVEVSDDNTVFAS